MSLLTGQGIGGSGLVVRAVRLWTPADDPTMRAWWDVLNTSTIITSGSNVTSWGDSSGNGYTLSQGNTILQPTLDSGDILFTGTQVLSVASRLGLGVNPDYCMIGLYEPLSAANGTGLSRLGGTSPGSYLARVNGPSVNTSGLYRFAGNAVWDGTPYSSGIQIFAVHTPSGGTFADVFPRYNGLGIPLVSTVNGSASSTNNVEEFQIGENWNFRLRSAAVLNSSDVSNIQRWEGYLAHRYNVASTLDLSHPHRLSPPTKTL